MSIRRNTLINLTGAVAPMVVSVITVPFYLQAVGEARYGVLVLVWMLVGYFGLIDFGLSRASANQMARLKDAPGRKRAEVFWTALALNGVLGLVGGVLLYGLGGWLLVGVFKMPNILRSEAIGTLPWIASAVPLTVVSGVLVGALEGRQRFLIVNLIQVATTILVQIVPLVVAYYLGATLNTLIPAIVLVRTLATAPLLVTALRAIPALKPMVPSRETAVRLSRYGVWVFITGLIIPILETLDKLVIGSTLGAVAVTQYAVPFNLVSRLRMVPGAVSRSLFPHLSSANAEQAQEKSEQAMDVIAYMLMPIMVAMMFITEPFMAVWISPDFARESAPIAQIILLGLWINSVAHVPFTFFEAQGKPDVVAKLHVLTLPLFLGLLYAGAHIYGIRGVAWAWVLRVWFDSNVLFWLMKVNRCVLRRGLLPFFVLLLAFIMSIIDHLSGRNRVLVSGLLIIMSAFVCVAAQPTIKMALLSQIKRTVHNY